MAGGAPAAPAPAGREEGECRLGAGDPWGAHPAVLHLDIDAFFASVEQLRRPALRGKPVAVGTGVVASVSYEARRFGIRAGTTLAEARRRCPQIAILPGHAPTYRAFAEQVFALAARLSPDIETFLDDALVDLTGTERAHGHLIRAAARLREEIERRTGLSVSLGLATNRMVARMVTRLAKPGGLAWLRPGGEAAFVARRPIEDLPGVGPRRARLLREMGLTRIGELRRFGAREMRELFGEVGLLLAVRARGEETRAIATRELPRAIRRETSFDAPRVDADGLEGMLHYLTERAGAQARRLGAVPRRLRVHARWADGAQAVRSIALGGAACPSERLCEEALLLLRALRTRRLGLRGLGVELSGLAAGGGSQLGLFDDGEAAGARAAADLEPGAAGSGAEAAPRAARSVPAAPARGRGALARPGRLSARRAAALDEVADEVRERFGFRALVRGR
ncbi:MAG: DNA polymerase IV, partial [Candidatus Eisenbacteria bacterium]|nr:DNA polymerase IV [Candidatus Eisenbacteria bacterium]